MTTSRELREIAVQALLAPNATSAGSNVYSPRTWSTWSGSYPVILVRLTDEGGVSWGPNGAPAFTVTATLHIVARVQATTLADDQGSLVVDEQLEDLREQIKAAVINYPSLMELLQQYPRFHSRPALPSEGAQPIGEIAVDIDLEYVQGPDEFYPVPTTPLLGIDVTVKEPDGTQSTGLTIDLPQQGAT